MFQLFCSISWNKKMLLMLQNNLEHNLKQKTFPYVPNIFWNIRWSRQIQYLMFQKSFWNTSWSKTNHCLMLHFWESISWNKKTTLCSKHFLGACVEGKNTTVLKDLTWSLKDLTWRPTRAGRSYTGNCTVPVAGVGFVESSASPHLTPLPP